MAGFDYQNLRLKEPPRPPGANGPMDVELPDAQNDNVSVNPKTKVATVVNDDATVTVYLDGLTQPDDPNSSDDFGSNLALKLSDDELGNIATELLTGIAADEQSRAEWLVTTAEGLKLLALVIENGSGSSNAEGASPIEGLSRYRHTMLLEAVIRFYSNAIAELLPTDGPVKIRNDDPHATPEVDDDANCLERDLNHFLTDVDKAYYPDTRRAIWSAGVNGSSFKKVYNSPVLRRQVSQSVNAVDLIVSATTAEITSAPRVTHRTFMRKSMLKRMQMLGAYRDIELGFPGIPESTVVSNQREQISGVTPTRMSEARDLEYELYECYCEYDIVDDKQKSRKARDINLPVPYKVTINKATRQILEIRRNWREDDDLYMPVNRFVKYAYLDVETFYGIGLAQILGSTCNAATALVRESIDAGAFASFPGGMIVKGSSRQNTSVFRAAPGEFLPIDTMGQAIQNAVMPFPYKEPGPAMFQIIDGLQTTGARVGGIADIQVGEGKQDAPVGTTIALIEQAGKPQEATHKGLHTAQSLEFELLVDRIREDPESFIKSLKRPSRTWTPAQLLKALDDYDLVPVADPNTSSRLQRIGKAQVVYQMAKDNPSRFNDDVVYGYVFTQMGIGGWQSFLQNGAAPPDPKAQADAAKAEAAKTAADADLLEAQTGAAESQAKQANYQVEDQNRDLDRQSDEKIAALHTINELLIHDDKQNADAMLAQQGMASDHLQQSRQHEHDLNKTALSGHFNLAAASQPKPTAP